MPEGPFGRDRPFNLGPFVSETDFEKFVRRVERIADGEVSIVDLEDRKAISVRVFGPLPEVLETSIITITPDEEMVHHAQLRTRRIYADTEEELVEKSDIIREIIDGVLDDNFPTYEKNPAPMIDGVRGKEVATRVETVEADDGQLKTWGHLAFGKTDFDTAGDTMAQFKRDMRRGFKNA